MDFSDFKIGWTAQVKFYRFKFRSTSRLLIP